VRYDYAWRRFRVFVFRAYGIPHEQWSRYAIDHSCRSRSAALPRICVTFGRNQKAKQSVKDEVEDALVTAVCYRHTLTLQAAQAAIARDWNATTAGLPPIRHRSLRGGQPMMRATVTDDHDDYNDEDQDEDQDDDAQADMLAELEELAKLGRPTPAPPERAG
jgi:hypothetical protein